MGFTLEGKASTGQAATKAETVAEASMRLRLRRAGPGGDRWPWAYCDEVRSSAGDGPTTPGGEKWPDFVGDDVFVGHFDA